MKRILAVFCAAVVCTLAHGAILQSGEWFINVDPGFGAGTGFALPATSSATVSVTVPASTLTNLAEGVHLLGVRLRDGAGQWGHVVWRPFHRTRANASPTLTAGEWFINEAPAQGAGTPFSVAATATTTVNPTVPVSAMASLSEGVHLLGVRLRDDAGRWGHVVWRPFYKSDVGATPPNVASLDYKILRGGIVVGSGTVQADPEGRFVSFPVANHKDGLLLDAVHQLQVVPFDSAGRQGHAVYGSFTYKRYEQAWQETNFTVSERSNALISGDNADPDKDGLTNAQERFFALNPRDSSDSVKAASTISRPVSGNAVRNLESSNSWLLGFRVPGGGSVDSNGIYRTSDLRYTLQENMDLGSWNSVPTAWITDWSIVNERDGSGRLQLEVSAGPATKRFFSLKGEKP